MNNIVKMYVTNDSIKTNTISPCTTNMQGDYSFFASNKARINTFKTATFESDGWKADGSQYIYGVNGNNCQLLSGVFSNTDRTFATNPYITIGYSSAMKIDGITLFLSEQYCTDFKVYYYSDESASTLISSAIITDNDNPVVYINDAIANVMAIKIEFIKTLNPEHFARLDNIEYGQVLTFQGEEIIDISAVYETDLLLSNSPNSQLNFTVISENGLFDILNPEGLYKKIIEANSIYLYIEDDGSISLQGVFFLKQYNCISNSITQFICEDVFGLLKSKSYPSSSKLSSIQPIALINDIFNPFDLGTSVEFDLSNYVTDQTLNNWLLKSDRMQAFIKTVQCLKCGYVQTKEGKVKLFNIFNQPIKKTFYYDDLISEITVEEQPDIRNYEIKYYKTLAAQTFSTGDITLPIPTVYDTPSESNAYTTYEKWLEGEEYDENCIYDITNRAYPLFSNVNVVIKNEKSSLNYWTLTCKYERAGAGDVPTECQTFLSGFFYVTKSYVKSRINDYAKSKLIISDNTLINSEEKAADIGDFYTQSFFPSKYKLSFRTTFSGGLFIGDYVNVVDKYNNNNFGYITKMIVDFKNGGITGIEVMCGAS